MKSLHTVAFTLLVIGGLNWGLTALNYNVVNMLLGSWGGVERAVYLLVGVSAIIEAINHKKLCRACKPDASAM